MKRWLLSAVVLVLGASSQANLEYGPTPGSPDSQKEIAELRAKADKLTKKAGELMVSQQSVGTDDTVDQLKKIVEELTQVRAALKKLTGDNTPAPKIRTGGMWNGRTYLPVLNDTLLGKTFINGFFQLQYTNSDQRNGPNDAFRARRMRLNFHHLANDTTAARMSIEFASGQNQTTAQIRDGFIQYRPNTFWSDSGPSYTVGQMNTPLGYEISMPSFVRTWTERALYNQTFFAGERGRGLMYHNGDRSNQWYVGAWNSLTVLDAEQVQLPAGQDNEVGIVTGFRYKKGAWEAGISGLSTKRPAFGTGANALPNTDRAFGYLDATYTDPKKKWTIKSELMVGRDRVPGGVPSAAARPVLGYHVHADYALQKRLTLMLRHEGFDRDTSTGGNTFRLWGFGLVKDIDDNLRVTLQQQWNQDQLRANIGQTQFGITTLYFQYRF